MKNRGKLVSPKPSPEVALGPNGNGSAKAMVPAIIRAVRLLDTLAASKDPLTLASLTDTLGLPKSTVHALCATLVHTGLVRRSPSGVYQLGMRIMDLGHSILSRTDAAVEFARISDSLDLLPEETVILSVLDGSDVVHVGCRNGSRPLGLNFRLGMRMPANTSASGKAMLSTLPEEKVLELERAGGFRSLTKKSVTDARVLLKELSQIRKRGYSVDDEGTWEGMMCFGAPVWDSRNSQAVAGVAVSFLKAALSPRQRTVAVDAIRELASTLSKRLGANRSSK